MPNFVRSLPNIITGARALLAALVFVLSLRGAWTAAFWLFIVALVSDFFDGMVARKLHVQSRFGEEFDAATDALLVAAGMLGLAFAGVIAVWFAVAVLAIGGIIGSERHIFRRVPKRWRPSTVLTKVLAVGCLFVAWTGIAWALAAKAFGWSWWYVLLTGLILAVCAVLKRGRIRTWLGRD